MRRQFREIFFRMEHEPQRERWLRTETALTPMSRARAISQARAAQGFTGVILAELLITPTGVGDLITYYRSIADYPKMFATIASIIALAAVSLHALERLERILDTHPEHVTFEDILVKHSRCAGGARDRLIAAPSRPDLASSPCDGSPSLR